MGLVSCQVQQQCARTAGRAFGQTLVMLEGYPVDMQPAVGSTYLGSLAALQGERGSIASEHTHSKLGTVCVAGCIPAHGSVA